MHQLEWLTSNDRGVEISIAGIKSHETYVCRCGNKPWALCLLTHRLVFITISLLFLMPHHHSPLLRGTLFVLYTGDISSYPFPVRQALFIGSEQQMVFQDVCKPRQVLLVSGTVVIHHQPQHSNIPTGDWKLFLWGFYSRFLGVSSRLVVARGFAPLCQTPDRTT